MDVVPFGMLTIERELHCYIYDSYNASKVVTILVFELIIRI
jgi:hypothetical protein